MKIFLKAIHEDKNLNSSNIIVTYQGRFSPPTRAHIYVYKTLCNEFGPDKIYILTADPKKLDEKNPYTFAEKKDMLQAAGVPSDKIKQIIGSAYNWNVIANAVGITNPNETVLVASMGAKDAEERTKYGTYYKIYNDKIPLEDMTNRGYIKIIANMNIDGTETPVNASSMRKAISEKDIDIIKQNVEPGVFNWLRENNKI
jgi:hypothetical protein